MRIVPIDFKSIARESGLRRGKVGFSPVLKSWGVFNVHGEDAADFCCIDAPPLQENETIVTIKDNHWIFE